MFTHWTRAQHVSDILRDTLLSTDHRFHVQYVLFIFYLWFETVKNLYSVFNQIFLLFFCVLLQYLNFSQNVLFFFQKNTSIISFCTLSFHSIVHTRGKSFPFLEPSFFIWINFTLPKILTYFTNSVDSNRSRPSIYSSNQESTMLVVHVPLPRTVFWCTNLIAVKRAQLNYLFYFMCVRIWSMYCIRCSFCAFYLLHCVCTVQY